LDFSAFSKGHNTKKEPYLWQFDLASKVLRYRPVARKEDVWLLSGKSGQSREGLLDWVKEVVRAGWIEPE
jgi:hypothetical protein